MDHLKLAVGDNTANGCTTLSLIVKFG
jgi:hypothetical protein